jgi:hypothetical protein
MKSTKFAQERDRSKKGLSVSPTNNDLNENELNMPSEYIANTGDNYDDFKQSSFI